MSSTNRRPSGPSALLQVAGFAVVLGAAAPAFAQEASGGVSTAIPTLRGSVDGTNGGAAAVGSPGADDPALPSDGGVGTSASSGDAATAGAPRRKFAPAKGTAKTDDRARLPRKGPPPLPDLQAYPTALRLRGTGAAIDTVGDVVRPAPTVAALPLTARSRVRIDDAPYDPVGVEVGSLRLTPFVTQSFGYDSNPDQVQTGRRPSAFERTEGGLGLISTWSRDELRADLRGGYDDFFSAPEANRPDATGTIDYRLDVDRDASLDAEARFALDSQRVGSPEVASGAQSRPLISTYGGALGGTDSFGRLTVALHGSLDRTEYQNAQDSLGVLQDLASENFDDAGLRLRATYEVTPVLRPFVDVFADDRLHDEAVDSTGYRRDSTGVIAQLGSSFELTRLLSGELSAGYGTRSYADPRLKDIASPVLNGVLNYAATPLTTISFRAATSFDETTLAGASGSESRSATLEVSHALLRNVTITGALSYINTQYVGAAITENTLAATLKADYHLSRSLVASATYNRERLESTLAGASFSQDVVLLGLRWQR